VGDTITPAGSGSSEPDPALLDRLAAIRGRVADAARAAGRTHEPTLIGDVTLKTRSMFRKRSGRPRSEISRAGETASKTAASAMGVLRSSPKAASNLAWKARAASESGVCAADCSALLSRFHELLACSSLFSP
jgi:hypothetical protein